jgi:ferredoxin-NADP reductase
MFEGPYGRMTPALRTRRKVTLIGSGVGITPLRALLDELPAAPGDLTLIHRTRGHDDVVFRHELTTLATRGHLRVVHLPGPRRRGEPSWLPDNVGAVSDAEALRRIVPDIAEHDVFICGPDAWSDAVVEAAVAAGVPRSRVHLERFTW